MKKRSKNQTIPPKKEALVSGDLPIEKPEPKKIRIGNALILVASVLFIYDAITFQIIPMIESVLGGGTPVLPEDNWQLNQNLVTWLLYPVFALFEVLACFGGFAWVYKKGKLQGATPLICILVIFALIVDLLLFITNFTDTQNVLQFIASFFIFEAVGIVYLVGWFLTKDDFEY